jgi:AcrR family transcriptional regulator
MEQVGAAPPSLAAAQLALTRGRIIVAARQMLVLHGLGTTVDQIAKAAGVSQRTIFRHFSSHDQLVTEAMREIFREVWVPIELPDPSEDLHAFLYELMVNSHRRNAEMIGRMFWDLLAPRVDAPTVVTEGLRSRIESRQLWIGRIAQVAWHGAGGAGDAPRHVNEAFWLHISGFATFSYMADFGGSHELAAESSTAILTAVLRDAVEVQQRSGNGAHQRSADTPAARSAQPAATGESGYHPT